MDLRIWIPVTAATTLALACTARTNAPGATASAMTEPAMVDGGVDVSETPPDQSDVTSEPNPVDEPAFRMVLCGDTRCGPDQRCCHATGQCFPADCPDCCDGIRQGFFGDGPSAIDMHRGPTGGLVRSDGDDGWVKHDIHPDEPNPAE